MSHVLDAAIIKVRYPLDHDNNNYLRDGGHFTFFCYEKPIIDEIATPKTVIAFGNSILTLEEQKKQLEILQDIKEISMETLK
jgi:hypothetical protein